MRILDEYYMEIITCKVQLEVKRSILHDYVLFYNDDLL